MPTVLPDTEVRVACHENAALTPGAGDSPSQARLVARFGGERTVPLEDGSLAFPAMDAPDVVRVEWLDDDGNVLFASRVEVVNRHYFELSELRDFGDGQDEFGDLPDDMLWQARQAATEVFEEAARRSFVLRYGRTRDYGIDDSRWFYLDHNDVESIETEGYRLVSDCQVERTACDGEYPRDIEYLYGTDSVPAQVSRAVLELAAYMLRPTNRPIGATGESSDAGYVHFTTAGRDGATDIPEVNAAVQQFGRDVRYVW